jgi:hypothetical protein
MDGCQDGTQSDRQTQDDDDDTPKLNNSAPFTPLLAYIINRGFFIYVSSMRLRYPNPNQSTIMHHLPRGLS